MKTKKSKCLLISWILGVLYALYLIGYIGVLYALYLIGYIVNTNAFMTETAEAIGAGITTVIIMPHLICTVLAVTFNILGWAMNKRGFALTGAILYTVALVLMPLYFMFVMIQMILSYVGFAKLKTITAANADQTANSEIGNEM